MSGTADIVKRLRDEAAILFAKANKLLDAAYILENDKLPEKKTTKIKPQ